MPFVWMGVGALAVLAVGYLGIMIYFIKNNPLG